MRIARALALAGIASRRKCEALILQGAVKVNGQVARDLGRQVEPQKDRIEFHSRPVSFQRPAFFLLHKPAGYTTTFSDPNAQRTVYELLPRELAGSLKGQTPRGARGRFIKGQFIQDKVSPNEASPQTRVFPVGRLDRDSTGLLLFTNDGELANRLIHPRYQVEKWYEVRLDRSLEAKDRPRLLEEIELEEGPARVEKLETLSPRDLRLLIREGKKREIRRIFQQLGYQVIHLCRIAFGPLRLGRLKAGEGRYLTEGEIRQLTGGSLGKQNDLP